MFCNRCGAPLQADYNLCPKCGRPLAPPGLPPQDRLERHLHLLGVLWMVISALWLIPSAALFTFGHAVHFMTPSRMFFAPPIMFGLGGSFLLVAVAGICVGWGLMRYEPWACIVAIIVGILALFHPPFGTALGIYTLWVMLSNDAASLYEQAARSRGF